MNDSELLFQQWDEEDKKMWGERYIKHLDNFRTIDTRPEYKQPEEDISLKLLGTLISVLLNDQSLTYNETCKEIKNVLIKNNIYYESGK